MDTGSASDNRPGAWREGRAPLPDLPDRGGSSFSDRRGFRSDDRGGDREFSRFGDRGSRDREGSDRGDRGDRGGGSSFGPRRNYGGDRERDRDRNFGGDRGDRPDRESDWGNRLSSRPPTAEPAARKFFVLQLKKKNETKKSTNSGPERKIKKKSKFSIKKKNN